MAREVDGERGWREIEREAGEGQRGRGREGEIVTGRERDREGGRESLCVCNMY